MSRKGKESLISGIVIFFVIGLFWMQTMSLPSDSSVVPRGILVLLTVLNAINMITDIRKHGKDFEAEGNFTMAAMKLPLLLLAAIAVYVALFKFIGYLPATIILLFGLLIYGKVRPIWLIAAIIAAYSAFVYVLFDVLLSVSIF